jgi:tRNA/tmRNA/rRNA uracil-C5-methylase (TrmA/RlmC/RlmD family)
VPGSGTGAQGDLAEPVAIGKCDYLHRECDAIDEMLDGLSGRLAQVKGDQAKLAAALQTVEVSPGRTEEAVLLETARSQARAIGERLGAFRLSSSAVDQSVVPAESSG